MVVPVFYIETCCYFSSSPPLYIKNRADIYEIALQKRQRKNPETIVVTGLFAPISKSVRIVGCGGGT